MEPPDTLITWLKEVREARHERGPGPVTGAPPLAGPGSTTPYGRAALDDELVKLGGTPQGSRNDQLNRSGFRIGQLVAGGYLDAETAWTELEAKAREIGLGAVEVSKTLRSGFSDGQGNPRYKEELPPLAQIHEFSGEAEIKAWHPEAWSPNPNGEEPAEESREPSTWLLRPLTEDAAAEAPKAAYLQRSDGSFLLYAGKVNGLIGESESGKSWLATLAVKQAVERGELAAVLDFEDTRNTLTERLTLLGVSRELRELVWYAAPQESMFDPGAAEDLAERLTQNFGLIIVDGVNAAMQLNGWKINSNDDATTFAQRLLRPLTSQGACVTILDQVTKNTEDRLGAIGAQAKRAMITGALIMCQVTKPFGRGQSGSIKLTVDKDRPGGVRGIAQGSKYLGQAHFDSEAGAIDIMIRAPAEQAATAPEGASHWEPTQLMEKISRILETLSSPASFRHIKQAVTGKEEYIRKAIDQLLSRGFITVESGPRGALLHTSVKPYRAPARDQIGPEK